MKGKINGIKGEKRERQIHQLRVSLLLGKQKSFWKPYPGVFFRFYWLELCHVLLLAAMESSVVGKVREEMIGMIFSESTEQINFHPWYQAKLCAKEEMLLKLNSNLLNITHVNKYSIKHFVQQ